MTSGEPPTATVPDGCTVFAVPGWAIRQAPEGDREPVPVGDLLLPRTFFVNVGLPDGVKVVLQFAVTDDGEIGLPQVWAHQMDVPQALDELRAVRPIEYWRRYAITKMVERALVRQLGDEEQDLDGVLFAPGEHWHVPGWAEVAEHVQRTPARGRRNRITGKHLDDVAQVYRAAVADGRPPTMAVADHFHTSHSTAARWVGMARKRGLLNNQGGDE